MPAGCSASAINSAAGRCYEAVVALDSARQRLNRHRSPDTTMGQQLNKHIKRKRRAAYLKRRKERVKAAAKKK